MGASSSRERIISQSPTSPVSPLCPPLTHVDFWTRRSIRMCLPGTTNASLKSPTTRRCAGRERPDLADGTSQSYKITNKGSVHGWYKSNLKNNQEKYLSIDGTGQSYKLTKKSIHSWMIQINFEK